MLLDKVQKGKPINDSAIKMLRKDGLIEGRKPHIYVSKQIAKATNKQVEYTLKKGFNDAECQEWIIKALKDYKVLSRKQINELLWNKLPIGYKDEQWVTFAPQMTFWNKLPIGYKDEQKISKIGNLLTKMRKQVLIVLSANHKWHLSEI